MANILSSIMNGVWALDPKYADSYVPFINALVAGQSGEGLLPNKQEFKVEYFNASTRAVMSSEQFNDQKVSKGKQIAIMSVRGVITKDGGMCSYGLEYLDRQLKGILNDDRIGGVLLDMDTPGGEASYTPIFGETIKSSEKPVLAYFNNLCASAGIWIASQCDEIYASHKNDTVGSIGTFISLGDYRKYFKKMGVNIIDIYATKSTEKNKMWRDALDGKTDEVQKDYIDPVNESFIEAVQSMRTISDKKAYTGKVYNASKAVKIGLIDGIKSFDACLDRLAELIAGDGSSSQNANNQINNSSMKKQVMTVAAFLGFKSLESVDGHISLREQDVAKIGAALAESGASTYDHEDDDEDEDEDDDEGMDENSKKKGASDDDEDEDDKPPKSEDPDKDEDDEEEGDDSPNAQQKGIDAKLDKILSTVSGIDSRVSALEANAGGKRSTTVKKKETVTTGAQDSKSPWNDPNDPINQLTNQYLD